MIACLRKKKPVEGLWILRERKENEKSYLDLVPLLLCPACRKEVEKAIEEAKNR